MQLCYYFYYQISMMYFELHDKILIYIFSTVGLMSHLHLF